jgi:predicted RNase H-like nuclease (RuvC/YqgF family)
MDPMSALSVATAVVQFVDFGSKLLEKASDIYSSHSDKSREEVDSDLLTQDLRFLVTRLRENARSKVSTALTKEETVLEELRERCESIGKELVDSFSIANQRARNRKDGKIGRAWLSFSLAVRLMWKREDIDELRKRLSSLRDQLHLHISVDLL